MKYSVALIVILMLALSPLSAQETVEKAVVTEKEDDDRTSDYRLIEGLLRDELYDLALTQIERYLEKHPDSPHYRELTFKQGEIFFENEQYDKAAESLTAFVSRYDSGEDGNAALYYLARSLERTGKMNAAEGYYKKLLKGEPKPPLRGKAVEGLAGIYADLGRYEECIILLEGLDESAHTGETLRDLALSYLKTERLKEAEQIYLLLKDKRGEEMTAEERESVDLNLGLTAYNRREYKRAAEIFSSLYERRRTAEVGTAYAWSLYKQNEYARAYDVLRSIEGNPAPDEKEKVILEARSKTVKGENAGAIDSLEKLLEKDPGCIEARELLIDLYMMENRPSKALPHLKYAANNMGEREKALKKWYRVAEIYHDHKHDYREAAKVFLNVADMKRSGELADTAILKAAKSYLAAGMEKEALDALVRMIREYPDSGYLPETYFLASEILVVMEDYETALQYYTRILQNHPDSGYWKKALLNKSLIDNKTGGTEQAIAQLERFLTTYPEDDRKTRVLELLARWYYDTGQYEKGLERYGMLAEDGEVNYGFETGLGKFMIGEYDGALESFSAAETARSAYWRGRTYLELNRLKEAVISFEEARRLDSESLYGKQALIEASEALLKAEKTDEAVELLEKLKQEGGLYRKHAQSEIERAFLSKGNIKEAVERIPAFYLNDPAGMINAGKMLEKGKSYLSESRTGKAVDLLEELVASYPNHPASAEAYYELGEIFFKRGDFPKAAGYFEKAIRFPGGPDFKTQAHFKLGHCYFKNKNYRKAAGEYGTVLSGGKMPDREHLLHYLKGICHQKNEEPAGAAEEYGLFLKKLPSPETMIDERVRVALYLQNIGRYEESIDFCNSVLEAAADEELKAEVQFYKAENYKKPGKTDKALVEYLKVTYLHSRNAMWAVTARFEAGRIYEQRGEWKEAVKLYRKIAEGSEGSEQGEFAAEKLKKLLDENSESDGEIKQEVLEE